MRRLIRPVTAVLVVLGALWGIGQALARRRSTGDESSDEFELASYLGGASWTSTAASFRRGVVRVVCGGVDLDLRQAVVDPGGATLELSPTFGGVNVTVPAEWRVLVEDRSTFGGIDAHVTPPDELPDGAPLLRVSVRASLGGVAIRAGSPAGDAHRVTGWATT
jgi:hypothetical protein